MNDLHDMSEHGDVVIVLEQIRGHKKLPKCSLCREAHINASEKYDEEQHNEHPNALAYWMGKLYCQSCYETLTMPYWNDLPKLHIIEQS